MSVISAAAWARDRGMVERVVRTPHTARSTAQHMHMHACMHARRARPGPVRTCLKPERGGRALSVSTRR